MIYNMLYNILSFDCALRSLAVCYVTCDGQWKDKMSRRTRKFLDVNPADRHAVQNEFIQDLNDIVNNVVKVHFAKVFDLVQNIKSSTAMQRTRALKKCLTELDTYIAHSRPSGNTGVRDVTLIEYQMSANDKSRCVSQQIMYHYTDISTNTSPIMKLMGPTRKNTVHFTKDLIHNAFVEKYASNYTANKNHCKCNFIYWSKIFSQDPILTNALKNIRKKNIDDIADAFMQMFAWFRDEIS